MEKIIINDYINSDPLIEENLDETLKYVNKIRLSCPNKTIWLYTGFSWEDCIMKQGEIVDSHNGNRFKRSLVVEQCNILIDGRYIESQRNPSLKWRGSLNQRVIDVQKSLEGGKIILWTD